jgi:hypothetical protein
VESFWRGCKSKALLIACQDNASLAAPRHWKDLFSIPEEGIMCTFLSDQGQVVVLMGLNGMDDSLTIFQSDSKAEQPIKSPQELRWG